NIVDITNFVMMEIGQPMHAFDLARLEGNRIVVRTAREGERFLTLDEEKRDLKETDLLICDAHKPVAIAGVMGGLESSVTDETTAVLLESAHFNASSVRKTAKHLQLSTDSSFRFERGSDPQGTMWALDRAIDLILQTAGGRLRGVYDNTAHAFAPLVLSLRPAFTHRILGIRIDAAEQKRILQDLQFTLSEEEEDRFLFQVPSFRSDIEREIDLVEEIARIHGYDNIPVPTRIEMNVGSGFDDQEFPDRVRNILLGFGYDEILSSSLVPRHHAGIGETEERVAEVRNPVSKERPSLRTSLLSSLLEAVDVNIRSGLSSLRLFEIGRVFSREDAGAFSERTTLGIVVTGSAHERTWYANKRDTDFFDLKGVLEGVLRALYLDNETIFRYDRRSTLSEHVLTLEVKGRYVGQAVGISDEILATFSIDQPVYFAELDMSVLRDALPDRQMYTPIARYPSVTRDLAVLLRKDIPVGQLLAAVQACHPDHLRDIRIVDVFTHDSIGKEKKSVAFSMTFQAADHTLTDDEVNRSVDRVIQAVRHELGAELRT
ncbi:MAG: phenylalanine--tRNA ligase subunit beta, partial [Bacteroidetes bacterium]|nr:phenylalanine--tRNA ligase subunit beta [Bacteroidota bacterium]